jgi:hypothetical protein
MKGSSLATVVLVAIISVVVAALVVNSMLGDPSDESVTITYMDVIVPDITEPDREVFSNMAVNPTVEVYVGECPTGEIWDGERQKCIEERDGDSDEEAGKTEPGE